MTAQNILPVLTGIVVVLGALGLAYRQWRIRERTPARIRHKMHDSIRQSNRRG
jgi:hypothetical protein